jgi:hypothetical protein
MAITVYQDRKDTIRGQEIQLGYIITGTDDRLEARDSLVDYAPEYLSSESGGTIKLYPFEPSVEWIAPLTWRGAMQYSPFGGALPVTESELSFDIQMPSRHMQYSLVATAYGESGVSGFPDATWPCGIGYNVRTNTVEGCDLPTIDCDCLREQTFLAASVDGAYIRTLRNYVGCTNSDTFDGWSAGEALLTRISGRRISDKTKWRLRFQYGVSLNQNAVVIGDITVTSLGGWEYLDIVSTPDLDESGYNLTPRPKLAIVHTLFPSAAFATLGIVTT